MGRPKGSRNKKRTETAEHANGETQSLESAQAQGEAVVERGRHRRKLPVAVDHETIEAAATEMAMLVGANERLKSERRDAMAEFNERRSHIDERMSELADTVTGGTVLQDIECVTYLLPTNEIQVVRVDTSEVVESRTATAEELQETLPVNGAPSPLRNGEGRDHSKGCHVAGLELVAGDKHSGWAPCVLPAGHQGKHRAEFSDTSGRVEQEYEAGDEYDTQLHKIVWRGPGDEDPILPDEAIPHQIDAASAELEAALGGEG
jgi:hypothetical protein